QGWNFQKTRLSESYGYEHYMKGCAEGTLQLLALHADGRIVLHSPQAGVVPKAGDTVVNFGLPRQKPAAADDKPDSGIR
ncbi:MAG TPA: hypothetical protein VFX47_01130, partial [Gammaproteobacteria bacterium]|nr:hypothetical protein [Gammaproteobacteria bacterium]